MRLLPPAGLGRAALADAEIVKSNLQQPNYQYPLIGNGGLSYMPGPTGFTDLQPQNAPYPPIIASDSWWSSATQAAEPFQLTGGYDTSSGVQPGTINSFQQTLSVASGVLTSSLNLTPPSGADGATGKFTSTRTEFVAPSGVLVIQVSDTAAHSFAVQIGSPDSATYSSSGSDVVATTSGAGTKGSLALAVNVQGDGVATDAATGTITVSVGPGEPATFYVAGAGVDSADPATAAQTLVDAAGAAGYTAASTSTTAFWNRFWNASGLAVPDPELMKWYIRGQYYLASLMANAQRPPGTTGPSEDNGGDVSLESGSVFDTEALLTADEAPVSAVFGNWVESTLPEAESLAADYTYNGAAAPDAAKFPWLSGYAGAEDAAFGPSPVQDDWEAYPSANAALIDLLQAAVHRRFDPPHRREAHPRGSHAVPTGRERAGPLSGERLGQSAIVLREHPIVRPGCHRRSGCPAMESS